MSIHDEPAGDKSASVMDHPIVNSAGVTKRQNLFTGFLAASCLVLVLVTFLLARQNRSLQARLNLSRAGRLSANPIQSSPEINGLSVGDHLSDLEVFAAAGTSAGGPLNSGGPSERRLMLTSVPTGTLLFIFSGGCPACDEMTPMVGRLAAAADRLGIPVMAIQADTDNPVSLRPPTANIPVCGVTNRRDTWLGHFSIVPGIVLVDRYGTLRRVWWGVLNDAQEREVIESMQSLPDRLRY